MMIAINWSLAKCSCPSWSANTDESALRSSVASLNGCNSSLHWWLGFWTFLVVIGVVLEVVFVIWEYRDELRDFRRGIIHTPERPQTVLFVVGLLGAGLVAAGVSGELWKESQIATVETCIREGNDALFLLLSKEAGDAKDSAKTAHQEVDAVGKKAAALMTELDKAEGKLRQLQIFALARHISDPDALVEGLRPLKGKQVVLRSYLGDAEGWLLCVSLLDAVQKAQMNPTNQCGQWPFDVGKPVTGLNISGSDSGAVFDAIAKGRIIGGAVERDDHGPAPLLIFAGIKNPFWLPEPALATPLQRKNKNNPKARKKVER